MKKTKLLLTVIMTASVLTALTGCGKSLDGNWILFERQWGDDYFQVQSSLMEDYGFYEEYYIDGETGNTSGTDNGEEFYYEFDVVKFDKDYYEFYYDETYYEMAEIKDGWLYVTVRSEDEDTPDYTYVYVREDDDFWDEYNNR